MVKNELMTAEFYNIISNCHSLRYVIFDKIMDPHAQLDVIEANQNIKQ